MKIRIEKMSAYLCDCPHAYITITKTQLDKSCIDATKPVREMLKSAGIHDYDSQQTGPEHKATMPVAVHKALEEAEQAKMSLYRPNTKKGDPRLWISGLKKIVKPGDVLVIKVEEDISAFNFDQLYRELGLSKVRVSK